MILKEQHLCQYYYLELLTVQAYFEFHSLTDYKKQNFSAYLFDNNKYLNDVKCF